MEIGKLSREVPPHRNGLPRNFAGRKDSQEAPARSSPRPEASLAAGVWSFFNERRSGRAATLRVLAILVGPTLVIWWLDYHYRIFEVVTNWHAQHRGRFVGEMMIGLLYLILVSTIFFFLKMRESQSELQRRQNAENSFRELHGQLEERFRSFMDRLPGFAWIKKADGNYVYMNKPLQEALPRHQNDWVGRIDTDFWTPEIAEEYRTNDQRVLSSMQEVRAVENWIRDGEDRNVLVSKFPIVDSQGGLPMVGGISIDITESRQTEQALRVSQSQLQAVLDNCPAMVFLKDVDGRYLQVNRRFEETFNMSSEQTLGRTDAEVFLPELAAAFRATDMRVLRAGSPTETEEEAVYSDGPHTYIVQKFPLRNPAGEIYAVGGISTDITARKRAEEASRASEERYRDLVENANDIIYSHDLNGNYTSVNKAGERITGYPREEALKMNFAQTVAPEYVEEARRMIARKLAGEKETVYDLEIIAKDGHRIALEVNTRLIHQGGVPVGIQGIARDVTERKRAQEALRESEEGYRDLVENSTELICTHDLDGLILSANRAAIELLGFESGEYIGKKNVRDILPRAVRDQFDDYLARLRRDGVASGLMLAQTRAGQQRIWEYRNTLRTEGVVKPVVRGMARDITEQKRAEKQIKTTTEQLRALSASLRSAREEEGTRIARELHDELGSSLTGLKFDLEDIHRSVSKLGDQVAVSTLQERIVSMTRLTDDTIHAIRRISSELRPSILDDLGLVAAIEWEAQQFGARSGILCQFHSFVENADLSREQATAIFRVFQETLTNILRHAEASRVDVTLIDEAGEFVLEVRDDGRGITKSELKDPRSLGLTGMRERVYLAGGTIEIQGAAGAGTVLTIRVPDRTED